MTSYSLGNQPIDPEGNSVMSCASYFFSLANCNEYRFGDSLGNLTEIGSANAESIWRSISA